jgi:hypothetical protein
VTASAAHRITPATTVMAVQASRAASEAAMPTASAVYSAPIVAVATPSRRTAAVYAVGATSVEPSTISPKNQPPTCGESNACAIAPPLPSSSPGTRIDAIETTPTSAMRNNGFTCVPT